MIGEASFKEATQSYVADFLSNIRGKSSPRSGYGQGLLEHAPDFLIKIKRPPWQILRLIRLVLSVPSLLC